METSRSAYIDKRDFRAVVFTSKKLTSLSDVIRLFDGTFSKKTLCESGGTQWVRAKYHSSTCFLRTSDELKRNALRAAADAELYNYDVYVLARERKDQVVFMVAVPFSGMARELFGKIHDRKPDSSFTYLRPELNDLVRSISLKRKGIEGIRAVAINWAIAGDTGRSDQITIRGSDVIESKVYEHLQHSGPGLNLSLRKIQVRYGGTTGREKLKLSFDKFGNYGIWVTTEGANLPLVFEVMDQLRNLKLIQTEHDFPVRNKEDEPILP